MCVVPCVKCLFSSLRAQPQLWSLSFLSGNKIVNTDPGLPQSAPERADGKLLVQGNDTARAAPTKDDMTSFLANLLKTELFENPDRLVA